MRTPASRRPGNLAGMAAGVALAACLALAAAAASPASAAAQVPGVLAVEAWGGGAVGSFAPTGAGLELAPGPAWGAALTWGPTGTVGGYVAYAATGFGCDGGLCRGFDVSLVSRGPSVGVRGELPVPGDPWLRAGVLLHRLEQRWTSSTEGRRSETTDAGPGAEAAVGLGWQVTERMFVTPGLHLGLLPTRAPDGVTENAFFTALVVGLRFQPGAR